jgi:formamidopyrimidine-DNA glycosylase
MPELPEVEVLVRHLRPKLRRKTILQVEVRRQKVLRPTSPAKLAKALTGARFLDLARRGKYMLFTLQTAQGKPLTLLGHLGMTGRMYLQAPQSPLPKHAAVVMNLGKATFVFEDPRAFGRFTLETASINALGPEALGPEFTLDYFARALSRSSQPIKVKLLDQALVAGIGNIYASESLFRARIHPRTPARRLKAPQITSLLESIREVLSEAISWGSTIRLDFPGVIGQNRMFYYGSAGDPGGFNHERLLVYDRAGEPCTRCRTPIKHLTQAARSTYFCSVCQPMLSTRPGNSFG